VIDCQRSYRALISNDKSAKIYRTVAFLKTTAGLSTSPSLRSGSAQDDNAVVVGLRFWMAGWVKLWDQEATCPMIANREGSNLGQVGSAQSRSSDFVSLFTAGLCIRRILGHKLLRKSDNCCARG
jgi:hypothetical protein